MKNLKLIGTLIIAAGMLLGGCSEIERYPVPVGDSGDGTGSVVRSDPNEFLTEPIANQYIIVFYENDAIRGNEQLVYEKALELMRHVGASEEGIGFVYSSSILGFSATLDPVMAEIMQANPEVNYVEQDQRVTLAQFDGEQKPDNPGNKPPKDEEPSNDPAQTTPGGITRHGTGDGTGKRAWIIDSGIDMDHNDLNVSKSSHNNQGLSRSFLSGKESNNPDDQHGHGTHVSGTVAAINNTIGVVGVAAGAEVVSVRVLDRRGSGTYSGVIAGIDYVADMLSTGNYGGFSDNAANMSLGGGKSQAVNDAVEKAARYCPFAVAAGNSSANAGNYSPASADTTGVYTISAMNTSDYWASFSNYGSVVDYCAVGVSVYSCYKNNGYATMSGTSMASPHACGLLLINGGTLNSDGTVKNDPDSWPDPIAH